MVTKKKKKILTLRGKTYQILMFYSCQIKNNRVIFLKKNEFIIIQQDEIKTGVWETDASWLQLHFICHSDLDVNHFKQNFFFK